MKLSNLVYAAIGYTLGARAGRERYEDIVRLGRRVAGSQTLQTTAGVIGGQLEHLTRQARRGVSGPARRPPRAGSSAGH